ncbi:MAG: TonB-dependent receptor [Burkholderiales bacterium]
MRFINRCVALSIAAFSISTASANCGSAFCSINTNSEIQGANTEPGFKFNLRYEFVKQDQPRQGTKKAGPQGGPGGHDELETINHNIVFGFDYRFNEQWSAGVQLPYLTRRHTHLHNPDEAGIVAGDEPEREEWKFSGVGDARVVGRYQLQLGSHVAGVHAGVKLPTGKRDGINDAGETAERTLQLGTGSTDLIAGVFIKGPVAGTKLSWFSQAQWQYAISTQDDFRPGDELILDLGLRYAITEALSANLQLNGRYKRRDRGSNAEPDESGGRYVFLSPGVSFMVAPGLEIYGYVQVPLYQNVNGVQLTQDRNFLVGVSYHF